MKEGRGAVGNGRFLLAVLEGKLQNINYKDKMWGGIKSCYFQTLVSFLNALMTLLWCRFSLIRIFNFVLLNIICDNYLNTFCSFSIFQSLGWGWIILIFSGLPGSVDSALIVRPLRKGSYFIMCGLSSPEVSLLPVGIADAHMFRSILLFK